MITHHWSKAGILMKMSSYICSNKWLKWVWITEWSLVFLRTWMAIIWLIDVKMSLAKAKETLVHGGGFGPSKGSDFSRVEVVWLKKDQMHNTPWKKCKKTVTTKEAKHQTDFTSSSRRSRVWVEPQLMWAQDQAAERTADYHITESLSSSTPYFVITARLTLLQKCPEILWYYFRALNAHVVWYMQLW